MIIGLTIKLTGFNRVVKKRHAVMDNVVCLQRLTTFVVLVKCNYESKRLKMPTC